MTLKNSGGIKLPDVLFLPDFTILLAVHIFFLHCLFFCLFFNWPNIYFHLNRKNPKSNLVQTVTEKSENKRPRGFDVLLDLFPEETSIALWILEM